MTNISYTHIILSKKVRIIVIRGIIHYSRQVCNVLFLAFQYRSPGGTTTAGEVCYLRLPRSSSAVRGKWVSGSW